LAFTFEIKQVTKLPHHKLGVLDGKVLDGEMRNEKSVQLVHGDRRIPMQIMNRVIGRGLIAKDPLIGISVDLRQPGMEIASEGDLLVCDD
jgi:hypothetical protein